jgi:predicted membrane chloride channel (bestrophin family)
VCLCGVIFTQTLERAQTSLTDKQSGLQLCHTQAAESEALLLRLRHEKENEEAKAEMKHEERTRELQASEQDLRECRLQMLELSRANGQEAIGSRSKHKP